MTGMRFLFILLLDLLLLTHHHGAANQGVNGSVQPKKSASKLKWQQELVLKDYLKFINYPEQLIHFPVRFPGTFPAEDLVMRLGDQVVTHQLSDLVEKDGNITQANVWFRISLNQGEEKRFTIERSTKTRNKRPKISDLTVQNQDQPEAVIKTEKLSVKVPGAGQTAVKELATTPAPVIGFSLDNSNWIGLGSFYGTSRVDSVSTVVIDSGPLFLKYQVNYYLTDQKRYTVELTAFQFEDFITFDEYLQGFLPEDSLSFNFSYKNGINPNGRLVLEKGGYETGLNGHYNSGKYAEEIDEHGELPYQLGQYSVVNAYVPAATTFWNDQGKTAISLACYRMADWKTHQRYIWNSYNMPDNLRFFQTDQDQFMKVPLVGNERHWAMKIFPREEVRLVDQFGNETWYAISDLEGLPENFRDQSGADPAVRLLKKLNGFSLQWVVDTEFEWDEQVNAIYNQEGEFQTYDQFKKNRAYQLYKEEVTDIYWEAFRTANPIARHQDEIMGNYAKSRQRWTEEQRREIRAFFLHYIYSELYDDIWAPNRSMIGGHPNFMMEDLYASYTALFPNHPQVQEWKKRYLDFFDEYKKVYLKDWDQESYALGGRHTENVACYSYASMRGLLPDYMGLMDFDSTNLLDDPKVKEWLRWHMYSLVTPVKEYDYTYTPPQGAHARERDRKDDFEFYGLLEQMAEKLQIADPQLSEHLLWALTKGSKGKKPNLESAIFNDYGAILRYDFGGPDEAYLNIQELGHPEELFEGYNTAVKSMMYRWRTNGNGLLYYAARDTIWSWNGVEANGDDFDIHKCPVFIVNENGLDNNRGHGILYNFDWAQFYQATGSNPDYLSRDVMMIRNDYVAVYDNVASSEVSGKFNWVNFMGEMPQILDVGAQEGDQLHLVTPASVPVEQVEKPYGVLINNSEYICLSDSSLQYSDPNFTFVGKSGYARKNHLALFSGESIALDAFKLEISDGEFGVSAQLVDDQTIRGRIAGRQGGTVKLTVPASFDTSGKEAQILRMNSVKRIVPVIKGNTLTFNIDISLEEDGYYVNYLIAPESAELGAQPSHPEAF